MSSFLSFLNTAMTCCTILGIAFMIVLSLPQSRMRDVMKKVLTALVCMVYIVSPIDFMPEVVLGPLGVVDDCGALIAGIVSLKQAISLGKRA